MRCLCLILLAVLTAAGEARNTEPALVVAGRPPAEVLRQVLAKPTPKQVEALGAAVRFAPDLALPICDALATSSDPQAALVLADLLVWCAAGVGPMGKAGPAKATEVPTAAICERAAALLTNPDPFVVGLAELAIDARLERDNRRWPRPWSPACTAAWYLTWNRLTPEQLLDCDYVRQARSQGLHLDAAALRASGPAIVTRAQASLKTEAAALAATTEPVATRRAWLALRRAARAVVLADPGLAQGDLLFTDRTPWTKDPFNGPIEGDITFGGTLTTHHPVADIWRKAGRGIADPAKPLLNDRLGPGSVRGMDLDYDGRRLAFSFVRLDDYAKGKDYEPKEPTRLHLLDLADGSLKPITSDPSESDIEPAWLPDGDLVFCTNRSGYGSQCHGGVNQRNKIFNLWRCAVDGSRMRPLTNNKDFDRYPAVMEDGRIIYVHWEYQERHLWQIHALWATRPDGTHNDAYFKQHISSGPMSLRNAQPIPSGQGRLIATATGHHTWEMGALMLVDNSHGVNDPSGMTNLTPGAASTEGGYGKGGKAASGGVPGNGCHYMHPYPLSPTAFLVCANDEPVADLFSIYLIDVLGNKELLHRERHRSLAHPLVVAQRHRPPVLPDARREPKAGERRAATVITSDVYEGTEIPRGTITAIRISQRLPLPAIRTGEDPFAYNHLKVTPGSAFAAAFGQWDWAQARVIGTVPVEPDGSAHFLVPVEQPVYFQALDAKGREVRRMRSNVTLQVGEVRSCAGCHETTGLPPAAPHSNNPAALRRAPSMPVPPPWGDRVLPGYEAHIQPIFDSHCVSCHDGSQKPDLRGTSVGMFRQGYLSLFGRTAQQGPPMGRLRVYLPFGASDDGDDKALGLMAKGTYPGQLVSISNRHEDGAEVTKPRAFGSAVSRLFTALDEPAHRDVHLAPTEVETLATWVDLNAPYWDTFFETAKINMKTGAGIERVRVRLPDPWLAAPGANWEITERIPIQR
jgi:hypothetical protein